MTRTDFTPVQISEIQASYRDSANPKKQIGILADLYDTTENAIREVLGLPDEPEGNKKKRMFHSYDQAIKKDVVRAVLLEGMTNREAAEKFAVPYGNVSAWVNKARKKQAEFARYAEEVQAEPVSLPVAVDPPADEQNSAPSTAGERSLAQRVLREVKEGVTGLDDFVTNFAGVDIFSKEEEQMLYDLEERVHGFLAGLETGINLMRGEAKVVASDS